MVDVRSVHAREPARFVQELQLLPLQLVQGDRELGVFLVGAEGVGETEAGVAVQAVFCDGEPTRVRNVLPKDLPLSDLREIELTRE